MVLVQNGEVALEVVDITSPAKTEEAPFMAVAVAVQVAGPNSTTPTAQAGQAGHPMSTGFQVVDRLAEEAGERSVPTEPQGRTATEASEEAVAAVVAETRQEQRATVAMGDALEEEAVVVAAG